MCKLKLYIAMGELSSERAVHDLKGVLDDALPGQYQLELINVLDHPEEALADGIFTVPTAVKLSPGPPRQAVGDFSRDVEVLAALDLPDQSFKAGRQAA